MWGIRHKSATKGQTLLLALAWTENAMIRVWKSVSRVRGKMHYKHLLKYEQAKSLFMELCRKYIVWKSHHLWCFIQTDWSECKLSSSFSFSLPEQTGSCYLGSGNTGALPEKVSAAKTWQKGAKATRWGDGHLTKPWASAQQSQFSNNSM